MSEVLASTDKQILTLTLNRPEKQNAITREMYQTLANAINEANGDFGVRAIVITSSSQHFTAGNDLRCGYCFAEHEFLNALCDAWTSS
ncbi:MAG: hypothetical protein EBW79_01940 [Actinobacteria bacterium]|nr:hypothetical protein [Actinomycetota bacterium]